MTTSPYASTDAVVHLRGVVAVLGGFPALTGVDLRVGPGEVVLLRGANGAGKTTVLKVCAGLLRVHQGSGQVLGFDLGERRRIRRRVAMLGHATGLYDDLSVAQNVAFWTAAAHRDRDMPGDALSTALERVGLTGRLSDTAVGRLSAGQRRRASLAVMLARRSPLWLLDEPHATFDASARDLIDALVGEAVASGVTVMLASHDDDRAQSIASRVVDLAGGAVVSDTGAEAAGPATASGSATP